ncbi:MAG: hypothetical protein VKP63_11025 [Cyanobacteriota bacterium]|nr:hypothetical protein [Cyanobacteriota bacterium]
MTPVSQGHSCQHGEDYVKSNVNKKTLKNVFQMVGEQHKLVREMMLEFSVHLSAALPEASDSGPCSRHEHPIQQRANREEQQS